MHLTPGQGTKIPRATEQLSRHATTKDPKRQNEELEGVTETRHSKISQDQKKVCTMLAWGIKAYE